MIFASICALLVSAKPVAASEGGTKEASNPSVQLGAIAIPVMVDGKLVNYIFLSIRINLNIKANEAKLREMEPYFRDALVRMSSQVSFAKPDHDDQLDEPRFKQVMTAEWSKIAGPGMIKSVDILSQVPRRRTSRPENTH
ncbi:MAG: hypothetical protein WBQ60_11995 [Asticcacaulis sp.]